MTSITLLCTLNPALNSRGAAESTPGHGHDGLAAVCKSQGSGITGPTLWAPDSPLDPLPFKSYFAIMRP